MKVVFTLRSALLAGSLTLILLVTGVSAQSKDTELRKVPFGAETAIEGVIVERSTDALTVRHYPRGETQVVLTPVTQIKEKKRNPFRKSKEFSKNELLLGLEVEISGQGNQDGELVAKEISFTQDDLKTAKTITSRVMPLESGLEETRMSLESTKARLSETEQKLDATVEHMEGQFDELDSAFHLVRDEAESAQQSADQALAGVENLDNRVSSLDEYQEVDFLEIRFDFNSADLPEDAKPQLDQIAEQYKNRKGCLFQVVGFASADGNDEYNRRLSKNRAETVVAYLTELNEIPLRRIISPYGFGETNPVADNDTLEGRRQNRRVEIKVLVNQGLTQDSQIVSDAVFEGETTTPSELHKTARLH